MKSSKVSRLSRLQHWQKVSIILGAYDAISIAMSYFLALWLRFDCKVSAIPKEYMFI